MRRTINMVLSLTSCLLLGCIVCSLMSQHLAFGGKDDEDEKVHELMEKTHEGKKSPWKKAMQASRQIRSIGPLSIRQYRDWQP